MTASGDKARRRAHLEEILERGRASRGPTDADRNAAVWAGATLAFMDFADALTRFIDSQQLLREGDHRE